MTDRVTALERAAARARRLTRGRRRAVLGLVGPPGAGKSTAAVCIGQLSGVDHRIVPMDGFHLSNAALESRQLRSVKGAPHTFDVAGYVSALRALHRRDSSAVHLPTFDRQRDEPAPETIVVPREVPLVITEGNYLLLSTGPWAQVRPLLTEAWYLVTDDGDRQARLRERHMRFGMTAVAADLWVTQVDEPNARAIAATRGAADYEVRWP